VGGVSERAGVKAGESNLSAIVIPSRDVTVKDILVFRKTAPFAGRRRNEDLGRSVEHCGYPPMVDVAPMTADVRRAPRRGTPSRMRHKAHAPDTGTRNRACVRETRPSLGPSTRVPQSSLRTSAQAGVVRRSLRHHGWANPRKWEEPALGLGEADGARLAAYSSRAQARGLGMFRKGRRSRPPSLRGSRAPVGLPARRFVKLQKSVGDV
jgi:hypothetical protein